MAKKEAAPKSTAKPKSPDGSQQYPYPWADPYPESKLKTVKRGGEEVMEETVFVRAVPTQDLIVNGTKYPRGVPVTLGSDFAHAHAAALKAPDVE